MLKTPKLLDDEHEELMGTLRKIGDRKNSTGKAVKELLRILEPHFEKEERVAMPLLGALPLLTSESRIENLKEIAGFREPLLQEYQSMFREHKSLTPLIERALSEARKERINDAVEVLEMLVHHVRIEEDILYPAALVAGTLATELLRNGTNIVTS